MWKASSQAPGGEIDAVYGAFGGSEAPFQGEPGGHGVEVTMQVEGEAGEAGKPASRSPYAPTGAGVGRSVGQRAG